jgi:hypothetical protein
MSGIIYHTTQIVEIFHILWLFLIYLDLCLNEISEWAIQIESRAHMQYV